MIPPLFVDESQCKEEKVEPQVEESSSLGPAVLVVTAMVVVGGVVGGVLYLQRRREGGRRSVKVRSGVVTRAVQGQEDLLTTSLSQDFLPSSPPLQPPPPYAPPSGAPPVPPRHPTRYEVIWT